MPSKSKASEYNFPPPGTVFVAPTGDGRFAAGRVLRREFHGGAYGALIVGTPWLGHDMPSLDLPELRSTLILSHHKWQHKPEMQWVHDPIPEDFILLGEIELSADDLAAESYSYSGWGSVPLQAVLQWRWDHDREALLLEEAEAAAALAKLQQQRAEQRARFMSTLTLDVLASRSWFEAWEASHSDATIQQCRTLLVNLINELRALPKLTQGSVKKHFRQALKELNRLDADQHFITTLEREDLLEAFEQIACAAKFPYAVDVIDKGRDW